MSLVNTNDFEDIVRNSFFICSEHEVNLINIYHRILIMLSSIVEQLMAMVEKNGKIVLHSSGESGIFYLFAIDKEHKISIKIVSDDICVYPLDVITKNEGPKCFFVLEYKEFILDIYYSLVNGDLLYLQNEVNSMATEKGIECIDVEPYHNYTVKTLIKTIGPQAECIQNTEDLINNGIVNKISGATAKEVKEYCPLFYKSILQPSSMLWKVIYEIKSKGDIDDDVCLPFIYDFEEYCKEDASE